jgi:hypothetical protein
MDSKVLVKGIKLIANLTEEKNKDLSIHTPNDNDMKILLDKLKTLLHKYEKNFNLNDLKFEYCKNRTEKDNIFYINMPELKNNEELLKSPKFILSYKADKNFLKELSEILNTKITTKTRAVWYPERLNTLYTTKNKHYTTEEKIIPKYPIFIISKGRWEKRLTSKYLDSADIDYKIVVEPQEYDEYAKHIDKNKILILPDEYLNKNQGSIPARNFVLHYSRKNGDKRHWILDDNIDGYYRFNNNERARIKTGAVFRILEDYVDRFKNVLIAGHNYKMFGVSTNTTIQPITLNTRIYSSILLSNSIPYDWRGTYNEDTDLSLRILKDGYPTVLFNSILADKLMTMTQKGGNTDSIYKGEDAHYKKTKSLYDQHPDVVKITKRFNRCHHIVNYTKFKTLKLEPIDDLKIEPEIKLILK